MFSLVNDAEITNTLSIYCIFKKKSTWDSSLPHAVNKSQFLMVWRSKFVKKNQKQKQKNPKFAINPDT